MDRAVAVARQAFDHGPWSRTALPERIAVLRRLSELIGKHAEELAGLITDEMGCPIALSRGFQSVGAKLALDAFLDLTPGYPWLSERTGPKRSNSSRGPSWRYRAGSGSPFERN